MASLSPAWLLEGLSPSHHAFQGHAAHPAKRIAELRPNDSPATWYHGRDYQLMLFIHSISMLHGALRHHGS
jgi:hypothetical protein